MFGKLLMSAATSGNIHSDIMPSKDSDQPVHSCSPIGIFTGCILDSQGCNVSSCGQ